MIYKALIVLFLLIGSVNSYAQIEKEPVYEMIESSFSGYYDISRDKLTTIIKNIKEKDKFLLHTLSPEDEIDILSEDDANKYFFQKYKIKKISPVIVFREKNISYNTDLEITTINSKNIFIKNFYDIFGNIPKEYNLYLVGKDLQYYPINLKNFEKERQLNFYTDYQADYNLALIPEAKNINITTTSNIYPFRNDLNYYFNFSKAITPKAKIFLEDTKPRGQNNNNFYIDFSGPSFTIEITNPDLKKDTFYFFNTPIDQLGYEINDKLLKIKISGNVAKTVMLKNYIMQSRNIKFCETDKCINRFITLEELLENKK